MTIQPNDERLLDLLVDGELAEDQRRELLTRLERQPDGWRSCALAFLEAQTWRQELSNIAGAAAASDVTISSPAPSITPVRSPSKSHPHAVSTILAMAASFLLAFSLGLVVRGLWNKNGGVPAPGELVQQEQPMIRIPGAGGEPSIDQPAGQPWRNVTVLVDGSPAEIRLPVVEGQPFDDAWLLDRPSALPLDVQRALERMGNQVKTQRKLVPFHLEDGRRGVVPMDQIEVQPVSVRSYQ